MLFVLPDDKNKIKCRNKNNTMSDSSTIVHVAVSQDRVDAASCLYHSVVDDEDGSITVSVGGQPFALPSVVFEVKEATASLGPKQKQDFKRRLTQKIKKLIDEKNAAIAEVQALREEVKELKSYSSDFEYDSDDAVSHFFV